MTNLTTQLVPGYDVEWLKTIPTRSTAPDCLCPGCYFVATEGELCLRCTLDGCDHEENRHG